MRMQCPPSKHPSLLAAALCLLLATTLSGCASKNPLMEDSAPMAKKAKPEPTPTKTDTEKATATEKSVATAEPAATSTPTAAETTAPASSADATANSKPVVEQKDATKDVVKTTSDKPATVEETAEIAETKQTQASSAAAVKADETAAAPSNSSVRTEKKKRFLGFLSPYRPDVQQGNFVSREMVAQLRAGMTQNQVVFLLGTPLLNDVFHQNRWDYIFRMQKGNGEITTSNVTIYFEDSLVSRFEGGGDLPTEADYLARIADKAKAAKK